MARSKVKALERRCLVLAGVLVLLIGFVLLRPSRVTGVSGENQPAVFPDFVRDEARRIEIAQTAVGEGGETKRIALTRGDDGTWTLPERFGYPALPGRATSLLEGIAAARDGGLATRRSETFDRYRPAAGWTEVKVADGSGRLLASFQAGSTKRKDLYLRLQRGDQEEIIRSTGLRPQWMAIDITSWLETDLWPNSVKSSRVVRVDIARPAQRQVLTVVKRGESGEDMGLDGIPALDPEDGHKVWWMASPPPAADADGLVIDNLVRAVTAIKVTDVVAQGLDSADYGLSPPAVRVTFWERPGDGPLHEHTLLVGGRSASGEGFYVKRQDTPWVYEVSQEDISRVIVGPNELRVAPLHGTPDGN